MIDAMIREEGLLIQSKFLCVVEPHEVIAGYCCLPLHPLQLQLGLYCPLQRLQALC